LKVGGEGMSTFTEWQVVAIIPAAGSGHRMRAPEGPARQKLFLLVGGKSIFRRCLEALALPEIEAFFIPATQEDREEFARELKAVCFGQKVFFCPGGPERQDSIANALRTAATWPGWRVPEAQRLVVIHDAARPLVAQEIIRRALQVARESGAACVGVPVKDTIKVVGVDGWITATPDRRALWAAQTPQVFAWPVLWAAYSHAAAEGVTATDDAALVERTGHRVRMVPGAYRNLKITTPEDLALAEALLGEGDKDVTLDQKVAASGLIREDAIKPSWGLKTEKVAREDEPKLRVGQGFDVHRLAPGRRLVLGGVNIPSAVGLVGHSDADVLIHALIDGLLGASGAGDVGELFPDTDPTYKDIDSTLLLKKVLAWLGAAGWRPVNVDLTVIAEEPKLAPYRSAIRTRLATLLDLPATAVNVKATTTEGLGFTGRREGIAAQAVVLLKAPSSTCPKV
jgi:2-C-methyl-D-erythritol 4-phosphate cytidylyltransferase/2-C-methyl-D-erythritol 2,4-cyclodiphosphate synthase